MNIVWILVIFSAFGALICARSRAAMPAAVFTAFAVVLFLYTSAGQEAFVVIKDLLDGADASTSTTGIK
jgi:hypothetical protein